MKTYLKTGLGGSIVMILLMAGAAFWFGGQLPPDAQVPVHFGPNGQPDRFAPTDEAIWMLWLLPGIGALLAVFLALAPQFDPRKHNLEHGAKAYLSAWLGSMGVLTVTTIGVGFAMVESTRPGFDPIWVVRGIMVAVGLLMLVLGNYLPKTRSSFFLGVRTPWTLSSEEAWARTHRLAGRLMVASALIGIACALLLDGVLMTLTLPVLTGVSALASVVYSWFAWKTAQDRIEPSELV